MQINDPISDLLVRIRNAQKAGHDVVSSPASKMRIAITNLLKEEGYLRAYKCIRDKKQGMIKIALKYTNDGRGVITKIRRVSTPGKRVYVTADKIPYVKNGYGIAVLSTSSGLITDREARKRKVGGEYICSVF